MLRCDSISGSCCCSHCEPTRAGKRHASTRDGQSITWPSNATGRSVTADETGTSLAASKIIEAVSNQIQTFLALCPGASLSLDFPLSGFCSFPVSGFSLFSGFCFLVSGFAPWCLLVSGFHSFLLWRKNGSFGVAASLPIVLHGVMEMIDPSLDAACCLSQSQFLLPFFRSPFSGGNVGKKRGFSMPCLPKQP